MKLADISQGQTEIGDSGNPSDQKPAWLDWEKFNRGRDFTLKHVGMLVLAYMMSFLPAFTSPGLLPPLMFTKQSNTPETSQRKYLRSILSVLKWFDGDMWDAPGGESYKLVQEARRQHINVARSMKNEYKDKLYISQYDLAVVHHAFVGMVVRHANSFGIRCTREDLDDYVYFWRCIGYLLGIDDKYNICVNGYQNAYDICREIEYDVLIPGLRDPPKDFKMYSEAYVAGLNMNFAFSLFSVRSMIAINAINSKWPASEIPKMGWIDKCRVWAVHTIIWMVWWVPGFEKVPSRLLLKILAYQLNKKMNKSK